MIRFTQLDIPLRHLLIQIGAIVVGVLIVPTMQYLIGGRVQASSMIGSGLIAIALIGVLLWTRRLARAKGQHDGAQARISSGEPGRHP